MVSCLSRAWAMATLVPTPSVEVARTGRVIRVRRVASKRPANPPSPPSTSGRWARRIESFISSTALSPASTSTPAPAYGDGLGHTRQPRGRPGLADSCSRQHRIRRHPPRTVCPAPCDHNFPPSTAAGGNLDHETGGREPHRVPSPSSSSPDQRAAGRWFGRPHRHRRGPLPRSPARAGRRPQADAGRSPRSGGGSSDGRPSVRTSRTSRPLPSDGEPCGDGPEDHGGRRRQRTAGGRPDRLRRARPRRLGPPWLATSGGRRRPPPPCTRIEGEVVRTGLPGFVPRSPPSEPLTGQ